MVVVGWCRVIFGMRGIMKKRFLLNLCVVVDIIDGFDIFCVELVNVGFYCYCVFWCFCV